MEHMCVYTMCLYVCEHTLCLCFCMCVCVCVSSQMESPVRQRGLGLERTLRSWGLSLDRRQALTQHSGQGSLTSLRAAQRLACLEANVVLFLS